MEIFVSGTIRKDQIVSVGAMRGCVSSKTVCLDGATYEAGSIMFVEHDGARTVKDPVYRGNFVFTTDVLPDAPKADLNALFAGAKTTTKKARATDGTVNDVH